MTREEAILEARRKDKAGEFRRRIVKRTPKDINLNDLELECGHRSVEWANRPAEYDNGCLDCVNQWIAENSE
jgi:hypothetical protein